MEKVLSIVDAVITNCTSRTWFETPTLDFVFWHECSIEAADVVVSFIAGFWILVPLCIQLVWWIWAQRLVLGLAPPRISQ